MVKDKTENVGPKTVKAILAEIGVGFGGKTPNVFRVLSRNEAVLKAAHAMMGELTNGGILSDIDREIVAITTAMEKNCEYCTTAHQDVAKRCGAPEDDVEAILNRTAPKDARSRALIDTVQKLYARNGRLSQMELADISSSGISEAELLEIIAYMSVYQMLSFVTNNWETPIDPQFRKAK
ncbi:MAG: carboxymuconolactone decarboxylase family protein [Litorimonas sp.]